MRIPEQNLRCMSCGDSVIEREDSDIVITKCHHLFHGDCFKESLLENIPETTPKQGSKKYKTKCPAQGCEENISHKLKPHGRKASEKTYEIINLIDVKQVSPEFFAYLQGDAEGSEAIEMRSIAIQVSEDDLAQNEDQKSSFKQGAMILGAILVGTIAGVIFHTLAAVAIGVIGGYFACFLASKVWDAISTIDFLAIPKGIAEKVQGYFSSEAPKEEETA